MQVQALTQETIKIGFPSLAVLPSNLEASLMFYQKYLGMDILKKFETQTHSIHWLGCVESPQSSVLELITNKHAKDVPLDQPNNSSSNVYWKIGLSLPDVALACKKLSQNGISTAPPRQFLDIGFLCDLTDPNGYSIELLQHDFQSNFKEIIPNASPLGQKASIGMLKLINLINCIIL